MSVQKFTDENFQDSVKNGIVLVDFWAEWCAPCRMIGPIVEELAGEMTEITFAKMNVDENMKVPQSLGISAIPTILIFKNGEIADRIVGLLPKPQIRKIIEKHI